MFEPYKKFSFENLEVYKAARLLVRDIYIYYKISFRGKRNMLLEIRFDVPLLPLQVTLQKVAVVVP